MNKCFLFHSISFTVVVLPCLWRVLGDVGSCLPSMLPGVSRPVVMMDDDGEAGGNVV